MSEPRTFVRAFEIAKEKAVETLTVAADPAPESTRLTVHVLGPTAAVEELAGRLQRSLARWEGGSVVERHKILWKGTYRRETFELEVEER